MASALLSWFEENGRDLPWRRTRDPWTILLCELMAQQTQVSRVLEVLPGFMHNFAGPKEMASRPVGDVIAAWSGLGYNRRAVNLHRAAVQMTAIHGGAVPSDYAGLLALPGIGPYTARAVRVFSFGFDDAVVDTNIGRVLARVVGSSLSNGEVQELADSLVPAGAGWLWNQALMEVGALRCRRKPQCDQCPLGHNCSWHQNGNEAPDPAVSSAKVSTKQSPFEGSDRQGRGALVRAIASKPVRLPDLAETMGWPTDPDRAERVAATVLDDGLALLHNETYVLPS